MPQKRTKSKSRSRAARKGGWNIREASRWSGIGEHQLRGKAKRGEIPHIMVGRRILIPKEAFVRWFNSGGTVSAA
jgi:excisionase family DNA binding protein